MEILTYCLPSLDCPSTTACTYFSTYGSGYFTVLMYFRTSRLCCLFLHRDILNLLASPSMPCITFIRALSAVPTAIELLSLFAMNRVTRHILSMWLLVPC